MLCLAGLPALASGCAVSKKHVVPPTQVRQALFATKEQLVVKYNDLARSVESVNAGVTMIPTAGSRYSGVIEEYHEVNGFILARKPANIRVIGQAPLVSKNVFDMVSDGETFRIFIPSKNKFIVGPASFERPAKKPIENLRPQHLLDALFWPEIPPGSPVLFEEWNDAKGRSYILTVLRAAAGEPGAGANWEIARKIWFDRSDLSLARIQIYGGDGRLLSDIRYADWQPVDATHYPRHIRLARPHDDYQLELRIAKLRVNETIPDDRFRLEQPPGTQLVRVGEEAREAKP